MEGNIRLISTDKLFGNGLPFPFGEKHQEKDRILFGDKKSTFKFEHLASEFEMSEDGNDSGIDSEVSTISPGSVASLSSPVGDINDSLVERKPLSLVVRDVNRPESKISRTAKHWKKSLTRNFLDNSDQENGVSSPLSSRPVDSLLSLSRVRTLPIPVAPTRPISKPRIVQPWNSPEKNILKPSFQNSNFKHEKMEVPNYSLPSPPLPGTWSPVYSLQSNLFRDTPVYSQQTTPRYSAPLQETFFLPSPVPSHQIYQNSIFSSNTDPLRASNENIETYNCHECKKSFSTQSGFSKHQQLHSSNQIQKDFSCKFCQKNYNSQSALKMHIRTHTLPCKCEECGKSFSRPWLLQGHMRTHTGEKPFSCTHCSRQFADKSNLRAHLQTHLENKKYSCPGCQKSFSRMSLLNKHTDAGCSSQLHSRLDDPIIGISTLRN